MAVISGQFWTFWAHLNRPELRVNQSRKKREVTDVRLTEIPCTEDGTYLDYDIYAEYPSVVGSGQPTVAVWLILPTVPTHTIDPKTKTITKLLRGDGLSGLNGIIPIAGADEQVHEFKYFLQYSYLNN